jgi:hypothetical protein
VTKLRNPTVLPSAATPIVNEYRETLSTKKSVRFMFDEDEQKASTPVSKDGECAHPTVQLAYAAVPSRSKSLASRSIRT